MNRTLYYFLWALSIILLCTIQTVVILSIPSLTHIVSLTLCASFFFAILRRSTVALFFAGITGYILDLYSALPFGLFILSQLLAVMMLLLMQKNVLKNFAIHAILINSLIALAVYHVVWSSSIAILRQLKFVSASAFTFSGYWSSALGHIGFQLVVIGLLFFVAHGFQKYLGRTTLHI